MPRPGTPRCACRTGTAPCALRSATTATASTPRASRRPGSAAWPTGSRRSAAACASSAGPPRGTAVAEPLRIVIAEDNYLVREGTRRLLEDSGAVAVVAAVGTAAELLDAVGRLRPDAVVTD